MDDDQRIPTNMRTLRILEVLSSSENPMTPTQINQQLGLPKQTVHRLCKTLVRDGFLILDTNGKRLRPSRRLRQLASGILFASRFHIARHQVLLDIASKVSETVNFVVPQSDGMTYLDRVETDWPLRIQLPIGTHVPFHCTASGKTFLASLSPTARRSMVESLKLERLTANTHHDVTGLLAELAKIARQGFAIDDEEFKEGMVAAAVPVLDPKGRFYAALAFHGPTQRLSVATAKSNVGILQIGARQLSNAIFPDQDV